MNYSVNNIIVDVTALLQAVSFVCQTQAKYFNFSPYLIFTINFNGLVFIHIRWTFCTKTEYEGFKY